MNSLNHLLALLPDGGWPRLMCDALWQSTLIAALGWCVARFFLRQAAARAWVLLLTVSACAIVPLASAASRSAGWTLLTRAAEVSTSVSVVEEPSPLAGEGRVRGKESQIDEPSTSIPPMLNLPTLAAADTIAASDLELANANVGHAEGVGSVFPDSVPPSSITVPEKHSRPLEAGIQPSIADAITDARKRSNIDWYSVLGIVWLAASTLLTLRLTLSTLAVRKILRRAAPCDDPQILAAANEAYRRVGLLRAPAVLISADIESPMVLALGRPRLLVPRLQNPLPVGEGRVRASESNADHPHPNPLPEGEGVDPDINWTAAFTHELAHVARGDGWSRLWMELAAIALPLQPLLWLVRHNYYIACEEACDDWSVSAGSDPVDLAATLTAWLGRRVPAPAAAIGMSSTKSRVLRLLAMREKPSAKLPRVWRWLSVPAVSLIVAGLAMAQTPAEEKSEIQSTEPVAESKSDVNDIAESVAKEDRSQRADRLVEALLERDPVIAQLTEQIATFDEALQIQAKAANVPVNGQWVQRIKAQIAEMKKQLEDRRSELRPLISKAVQIEFETGEATRHLDRVASDGDRVSVPVDPLPSDTSPDVNLLKAREDVTKQKQKIVKASEDFIKQKQAIVADLEEALDTQIKASKYPQYDPNVRRLREQIAEHRKEIAIRHDELAKQVRKEEPNGRGYEGPSIGAYVVEPPDVLSIDLIRAVPKEPTKIAPLDKVLIEVAGTAVDQPIRGTFQVDSTGEVVLGPAYGAVNLKGLTRRQAQAAVDKHLCDTLADPVVALTIDESRLTKGIAGEHLVAPDGMVNLGAYGGVYVAGMTIPEARAAIEKKLAEHFESPQITLDVFAYNSKVYYVIVQGIEANGGENIHRFPITGNDTVLDAIANIGGTGGIANAKIWVSRPAGDGKDVTLEVTWEKLLEGGSAANFRLQPGDRVFIMAGKKSEAPHFPPESDFQAPSTKPEVDQR